MATKRLALRDYAVGLLRGDGLPAGATVHASRTLPFDPESLGEAGAIAVYHVEESVAKGPGPGSEGPLARRALVLRCECR
jgi:hypothetical protein